MALISSQFFDADTFQDTTHSLSCTVPAGTKRMQVFFGRPYTGDEPPTRGTLTGGVWTKSGGSPQNFSAVVSARDVYIAIGSITLTDPVVGAGTLDCTFDYQIGRYHIVVCYWDDYLTLSNGAATLYADTITLTSASGATAYAFVYTDSGAGGSWGPNTGETEVGEWAGVNLNGRSALYSKAGASSVTIDPIPTSLNNTCILGYSASATGGGSDATAHFRRQTQEAMGD